MNTRIATKADINLIKNIWENSGENSVFSKWFFDKIFYSDNAVITEEDNCPLACACTVGYTLDINKARLAASYIVSMRANPENRTANVLNTLAADTLSFIAGKGMPIAFTVPDNYKFFEKYGFSLCYDYMQYDITSDDIPGYEVSSKVLRPENFDSETVGMLNAIYEKFIADKNGAALRTLENWRYIADDLYHNFDGKCIILKNDKNEPIAYMFYILRDNKLGVYELCYTDKSAYEQMLGLIKAFSCDKISLKVPSNDLFYMSLCDKRMAVTRCPFAIARITNVKTILELFADNAGEDIRLQVIDRVMEENNKTFTFSQGSVITIETDSNVAIDIGTLTQLVLGYLSVDEASSLNLIKGDATRLKSLFKKQTTYINMLN